MRFFQGLFIALPLSLAIWALASIAAHSQEQQSPQIRALSSRLMNEINANIGCTTQAIEFQDKLAASQAEVKRLTDKYEPVKKPAAK